MAKIIYVPLEHIDGRYTVHLDRDITNYLNSLNDGREVIRIYPDIPTPTSIKAGSFLDAEYTIRFKSAQMAEIARLYRDDVINSSDIIFFSDLWFPGIEGIPYMNYFAKKDVKIRGLLHAGSFTDTDFVRDLERWAKNFEDIIFDITDKIYVGSEFIKQDIIKKRLINPHKLIVTGFPLDITELNKYTNNNNKQNIVIFNGRNCDEKQPWLFDQLASRLGDKAVFINTQQMSLSKPEYYELLSTAKVVVSFALQENFGFGIMEAAYLGAYPIVPNRLVYPEYYSSEHLYDSFEECIEKVSSALDLGTPIITTHINIFTQSINTWFK